MNEDDKFNKFFKMLGVDYSNNKKDESYISTTQSDSSISSNKITSTSIDDYFFKNKIDEIKQKFKEEMENQVKANEHPKRNYTIVSGVQKVYHDLLLSYKGDIDTIINEALDGVLINPEDSKPYIVNKAEKFNTNDQYIDTMLNKHMYYNGSAYISNQPNTYQTSTIVGSHTHSINSHPGFSWHHTGVPSYLYNNSDDSSDFINIDDYEYIKNEDIIDHLIASKNWEYAGRQSQQRLILERTPKKYKDKKDIHDVEFCVEFIEQHPQEDMIAETHPLIIQTKEFQKQIKLLKLKDKYIPSE